MKGVILAGGMGTRLRPCTLAINKHLLPVYDRPMLQYPIETLVEAGIDDVLVVTGPDDMDRMQEVIGGASELGLRALHWAVQPEEGGVADALRYAREFAERDRIAVILGDNIVVGSIAAPARAFEAQPTGAKVLLSPVRDPCRFGIARLEGERIVEITEKPDHPPSNLAVTGIYFYDRDVFDMIDAVTKSTRGELEITDVNCAYLERGDLTAEELEGRWMDAGTFESLHAASIMVAEARQRVAVAA